MGQGQAEYPREAMLKEEAGTWPGERALESRSREQEGWGVHMSWGLAVKAQESLTLVGGSSGMQQRWMCLPAERGHKGPVSQCGVGSKVEVKQSKIAVKVLGKHLLSQMEHPPSGLTQWSLVADTWR